MALVDPEFALKLAPPSWRPTLAAIFVGVVLTATVIFTVYQPLLADEAAIETNKAKINNQGVTNDQIVQRLTAIERRQGMTQQQLDDLQATEERNSKNQDIILQFLLTGQRPKHR